MKNFKFQIVVFTLCIALYSCSEEEGPSVPNNPGNPLSGVYILYVGSSGKTDYAVYNPTGDTVTNDVYMNSNSGKTMDFTPGDMKLNADQNFYVSALGQPGGQGTVYKINSSNNQSVDSIKFGSNPYGFVINNNRFIISNFSGAHVSILDLDFNMIEDSIEVGDDPRFIIYGMNKYVVTKSGVTTENSVAFVDEVNNQVTKLFYPTPPVSALFNSTGFFVSAFTSKKIYYIDRDAISTIDSFTVPTAENTINDLVLKTQTKFFIVAGNREIWEATVSISLLTFRQLFAAQSNVTIVSIAYESTKNEVYIADAVDFIQNGKLHIIDAETGIVKNTFQLGGTTPAKIVFKY